MTRLRRSKSLQLASTVLTHGISTGITVYLAILAGNWLDARLGSEPWAMVVLMLLTLAANLRLMVSDILRASEQEKNKQQGQPKKDGDEATKR